MNHSSSPTDKQPASNEWIAQQLEEIAELLEAQQANPFRVQAYRNAAATLRGLERPVAEIIQESGVEYLEKLPAIGKSLARSIDHLAHSGRLPLLQRLRGDTQPEQVFTTVPGIGPKLAERIRDTLDIETLADLQAAAYDGRLAEVPGFGPKRILGVRESLAGRLRQQGARYRQRVTVRDEPTVAELLDVDQEYRKKATQNRLPTIAPRRFNPTGAAWLPILHTRRESNHYTVLYSNTSRAHEFGMTQDWVVIYRDDRDGDGQWTVITSQFGPLRGKRVVRGREAECRALYGSDRETVVAVN